MNHREQLGCECRKALGGKDKIIAAKDKEIADLSALNALQRAVIQKKDDDIKELEADRDHWRGLYEVKCK